MSRCASDRARCYTVMLVVLLTACTTNAGATSTQGDAVPAAAAALQISALSRGSGVPDAARQAFDSIAELLESARTDGAVVSVERSVIGLEGEVRLCVVLRDESARASLEPEIERLGAGVDLLEIRWSACSG
jgi:hypothetical protein